MSDHNGNGANGPEIDEELARIVAAGPGPEGAPDLSTEYLGLPLNTPIVASSSPLTGDLPSLRALETAGIGAVVLPSLFEEQVEHESSEIDRMLDYSADANPEATFGYVPRLDEYNTGAVRYLRLLRDAKDQLSVPVIASINGVTPGGWTRYAKMLADSGADAIELNVYRVAAHVDEGGRQVEAETLALVEKVASSVDVPVAVKLGASWSAFANFATQVVDAGAKGLVLFNRFYQPDIDLETLSVGPRLVLSTSESLRVPLRWIAILYDRVDTSLAATSGVHTSADVVKALLAGADVTMMTSALLKQGPEYVSEVTAGVLRWLTEREYASVSQLKGSVSQAKVGDPAAFERANYLETLTSYASTFLR